MTEIAEITVFCKKFLQTTKGIYRIGCAYTVVSLLREHPLVPEQGGLKEVWSFIRGTVFTVCRSGLKHEVVSQEGGCTVVDTNIIIAISALRIATTEVAHANEEHRQDLRCFSHCSQDQLDPSYSSCILIKLRETQHVIRTHTGTAMPGQLSMATANGGNCLQRIT